VSVCVGEICTDQYPGHLYRFYINPRGRLGVLTTTELGTGGGEKKEDKNGYGSESVCCVAAGCVFLFRIIVLERKVVCCGGDCSVGHKSRRV
jgi:hypothetical protein